MIRKSILIAAGLAMLAMYSSCSTVIDGVGVSIGMQSTTIDFVIPVITTTDDTSFAAFNTFLNIDSIIRASSSFSANNIKSAKISSATVELIDGDDVNNWGALQSYKFTFASDNKPGMITVVQNDNNPDDGALKVSLPVDKSMELKDYFKANNLSYNLIGRMRRTTTKELHCHALIKYTVKVGLNV